MDCDLRKLSHSDYNPLAKIAIMGSSGTGSLNNEGKESPLVYTPNI